MAFVELAQQPPAHRRLRPRGICGYRPRRPTRPGGPERPFDEQFREEGPGAAAVLSVVEQFSDDRLRQFETEGPALREQVRREIPDFDWDEAAEVIGLYMKGSAMSDPEREQFETSPAREYAMLQVTLMAVRIEAGRRRERRDSLYLGPRRYAQMSRRFSRRWGHLRPSQINRDPHARRYVACELYGLHGRAPRPATNTRTRGSRRGATTRSSSRGGDPGDGDPEPPPHPATPARAGALMPVRGRP